METPSGGRSTLVGVIIGVLLLGLGALCLPVASPSRSEWDARPARMPWPGPIGSRPRPAPPRPEGQVVAADGGPQFQIDVRDDADAPVADANVTVRTADGVLLQTSDGGGQVRLRLQRPGPVLLHAAAEGYDDASVESAVSARGGSATIVLRRAGDLGGHVVGYAGQPDDLIVLAAMADDPGKLRSAPVTPSGEFRFAPLPAGAYVVGLQPAGFETELVTAHIAPGEHTDVELTLAQMGAVELTAVLPSGTSGSRVAALRFVRAEESAELTRSLALTSGIAQRIDGLPIGHYAVELTVAGLAQRPFESIDVIADQVRPLRVVWPAGRIAGRVSAPSRNGGAASVSAFKVVARTEAPAVRDNNPEISVPADPDGSYVLSGLDAGRYLVVARQDPLAVSAEVALAADEDRTLDLRLATGRTIVARVRYRGAPVEGARVFATSAPYAESSRSAETDARGLVRLQHLTGGAYAIRAVWIEGEDGPLRQAHTDVELDRDSGAVELDLD